MVLTRCLLCHGTGLNYPGRTKRAWDALLWSTNGLPTWLGKKLHRRRLKCFYCGGKGESYKRTEQEQDQKAVKDVMAGIVRRSYLSATQQQLLTEALDAKHKAEFARKMAYVSPQQALNNLEIPPIEREIATMPFVCSRCKRPGVGEHYNHLDTSSCSYRELCEACKFHRDEDPETAQCGTGYECCFGCGEHLYVFPNAYVLRDERKKLKK